MKTVSICYQKNETDDEWHNPSSNDFFASVFVKERRTETFVDFYNDTIQVERFIVAQQLSE